ncbi:MAG: enoyl-CoA hydratase/isomerase family protein [Anaerolineales bacterium]
MPRTRRPLRSVKTRTFGGRDPAEFGFRSITYEKAAYRATVTINRPEVLNALNHDVVRELNLALKDVSWDDAVAVLVLTGAGDRAFCSGADMAEQEQFLHRPRDYWKWMGDFLEVHERLRNLGKPSIARLNGIVVGGGNELNLSCDLAVAADDIYIRHVGTSHGSVALAGATQFLPLVVGERRAREILLLNEEIPAWRALEWGLVNAVVPRPELDSAVDELVEKLVAKFPEKTRYTRQQLNFWRDLSWALTVGHGRDWLATHNSSPETAEGVHAFLEKRAPDYMAIRRRWAEDRSPEWAAPPSEPPDEDGRPPSPPRTRRRRSPRRKAASSGRRPARRKR